MESLQHIIHMKHELLERETFSRQAVNYGEDMSGENGAYPPTKSGSIHPLLS